MKPHLVRVHNDLKMMKHETGFFSEVKSYNCICARFLIVETKSICRVA